MIDILKFFIEISVLILIHEAGHFIVAKRAGVWVEEFGFGLPPRIIGLKRGETLYSLNLLPFGGFVKLHGENDADKVAKPTRAFANLAPGKKIPIIVAGVVMNFLLAIVLFSISYSITGIPKRTADVRVAEVSEGSPAQAAGILSGDIITSIDSENVTSVEAFQEKTESKKGTEVTLMLARSGEAVETKLTPRVQVEEDEGAIGVAITDYETYFPSIWQRPFVGAYYGVKEAIFWGGAVVLGFGSLIVNMLKGIAPVGITGPVGVYALTTQAARYGYLSLINFVGILSVNLAILNIMPFPALDGGRLVFIVFEKVFKKKVSPKIEGYIHMTGMAILLLLIVAVTYSDIKNLIEAGSVKGFIEKAMGG